MRTIIVGTSFAAIPAIMYLVDLGFKPTVIDVGNELNSEKKYLLKKKSFFHMEGKWKI